MIKSVIIQLRRPSGHPDDHGLVAIGHYTVEDGVLTMLDDDGKPLRERGKIIKRTLAEGDDPEQVARRITRDIAVRPDPDGFRAPIHYPDVGWR
jgi:hypothetical protein